MKRINSLICCMILTVAAVLPLTGCSKEASDTIVLRICNWEEYIDEGEWAQEETIELSDGTLIRPKASMIEDFEQWYYEQYGQKVSVEYSTFGTNEELYNQMTLGDEYDLVCPSEYMIMKLMTEDYIQPFSDSFMDKNNEYNYYINGLSPYIRTVFDGLNINGAPLSKCAAGYMWGTLGIVYNPEEVTDKEAASWSILNNKKFYKQVTIKDSVRDAFFAGISIINKNKISSNEFLKSDNYRDNLSDVLNDTSSETVNAVGDILSEIKDNVYSFETDSGKADMATGKVVANMQWSGDAVYTLNEAEADDLYLCYSAPEESVNLWFDGWCMMKKGIAGDTKKQHAAESFINFVSMPENAIRNMYYIGYTSVISGGENSKILQYADYCYGADEEMAKEAQDELVEYPLDYFFAGTDNKTNSDDEVSEYYITTLKEQTKRQLFAQYPTKEVIERSVVMAYFNKDGNQRINQMWTDVRCFDLKKLF
ncbi:MAG: extracellular solute-binding protein [Eubacteriales bacterium]|nr:extracellular solute-binding protein [Eubacteriales bacterium]